MAEKLKQLRRAGECATCACSLRASTHAWRESKLKTVTCVACHQLQAQGLAGRPRSTPLVTTSTSATQTLAPTRLANHLQRELSESSVLISNRKSKGTRSRLDHLVITPGGVWIIETKNYKGHVEQRDEGRQYKSDIRLYVGGRDRSKALLGTGWQHKAVTQALLSLGRPEVPVHQALCLDNADWPVIRKPFKIDGIWVLWAPELVEIVNDAPLFGEDDVANLAVRLGIIFPAS